MNLLRPGYLEVSRYTNPLITKECLSLNILPMKIQTVSTRFGSKIVQINIGINIFNVLRCRTYTNDEFDQYMKQPNLAIRQNFHFMIFGLDRSTYTVREIY
jgi:hypothetical protein